jgi:hypothetical protein
VAGLTGSHNEPNRLSPLWVIADIRGRVRYVRFTPERGHAERQHQRPLSAKAEHAASRHGRRPQHAQTQWSCFSTLSLAG